MLPIRTSRTVNLKAEDLQERPHSRKHYLYSPVEINSKKLGERDAKRQKMDPGYIDEEKQISLEQSFQVADKENFGTLPVMHGPAGLTLISLPLQVPKAIKPTPLPPAMKPASSPVPTVGREVSESFLLPMSAGVPNVSFHSAHISRSTPATPEKHSSGSASLPGTPLSKLLFRFTSLNFKASLVTMDLTEDESSSFDVAKSSAFKKT